MINLGKKIKTGKLSTASPDKGPSIFYPEFSVDGIPLPLNPSDVGKTITAMVQLKVKKAGAEMNYSNKKEYRASFCVVGIKFPGKNIKSLSDDELDEAEHMEYMARGRR